MKRTRAARQRHTAIKHRVRARQPFHIRVALHPASLFMLLVVGVFIAGWTLHASADSYDVTATVPAQALTEGAVITTPLDGATVSSAPILVEGTCPDGSYVTLTRNGLFSGVAVCAVSQTFSISTSLSAGANELVAQDFNITDDPGPATPSITVHYTPPDGGGGSSGSGDSGSGSSSSGGSESSGEATKPLLLVSDYRFQAIPSDETFTWNVSIRGGSAPYVMTIDWGDDNQTLETYTHPQLATISHDYANPGYFTIIVSVSDSKDQTTTLQLIAFVKAPGATGIVFANGNHSSPGSAENPLMAALVASKWLLVAWPTYVVASLMVASFWLGERQQIQRLLLHHVRLQSSPKLHRRHPA